MIDTSPGAAGVDGHGARQSHRQPSEHQLPSPVTIAVVCESVALLYSVGANIADVWGDGWVAFVVALFIPLWLVGGTYLFLSDRIPRVWWGAGAVAWYANLAAAIALVGPAAAASYWHQRELLLSVGAPWWMAATLPLPVDGLVLRAALTLFRLARPGAATAAAAATSGATTPAVGTADEPHIAVSHTAPLTKTVDPQPARALDPALARLIAGGHVTEDTVERARAMLAADPSTGRPTLRADLGVTDHVAKALRRGLAPIRPVRGEAS